MERNLTLFLDHTEQHIIDQIKQEHPEWVEEDGICSPCAEYYRKQLKGELSSANIGPGGRQRRYALGITLLGVSLCMALIFIWMGVANPLRLFVFVPVFLGMVGLIQAREKTCALLAELGLRDMDSGQRRIEDLAVATQLRLRGRVILIKSLLVAAILTGLFFLFS